MLMVAVPRSIVPIVPLPLAVRLLGVQVMCFVVSSRGVGSVRYHSFFALGRIDAVVVLWVDLTAPGSYSTADPEGASACCCTCESEGPVGG